MPEIEGSVQLQSWTFSRAVPAYFYGQDKKRQETCHYTRFSSREVSWKPPKTKLIWRRPPYWSFRLSGFCRVVVSIICFINTLLFSEDSEKWVFIKNHRGIIIKKVKCSRYRPGVAQRVGWVIALLFHNRGTRRGWVVSSTPRPHFTPGKDPVPIL